MKTEHVLLAAVVVLGGVFLWKHHRQPAPPALPYRVPLTPPIVQPPVLAAVDPWWHGVVEGLSPIVGAWVGDVLGDWRQGWRRGRAEDMHTLPGTPDGVIDNPFGAPGWGS